MFDVTCVGEAKAMATNVDLSKVIKAAVGDPIEMHVPCVGANFSGSHVANLSFNDVKASSFL